MLPPAANEEIEGLEPPEIMETPPSLEELRPPPMFTPTSSQSSSGNVLTRPHRNDSSSSQGSETYGTPKQPSGARRFERSSAKPLSESPMRLQMPIPFVTPGQLAFSAMQFLPMPVLVLNSLKTVVLANEAMGRLLGLIPDTNEGIGEDTSRLLDQLNGQSLSQIGIDMIQNGRPVWVAWDTFFQSLVDDMSVRHAEASKGSSQLHLLHSQHQQGDKTPTTDLPPSDEKKIPSHTQQTVIEVVVSRNAHMQKSAFDYRGPAIKNTDNQQFAKMMISVWEIAEHQTYFTLTFTNTESESHAPQNPTSRRKHVARPSALESAERSTIATASNPPSIASSHGSSSSPSYRISPSSISLSSSPFPPLGPPFKSLQSAPSVLQKMTIIKDSLLDNTETPIIAMWKDCTVAYPNAACRKLMIKDVPDSASDGLDMLSNWSVYTEDFSRPLERDEYPIAILLRTQTPFSGMRVGVIDRDGNKLVLDILAEAICDEETGEFLAGVVTCRDVTGMAKEMDQMKVRDVERFKLICKLVKLVHDCRVGRRRRDKKADLVSVGDIIPQLVWTTDKNGSLDFFNTRWTDFTGMSLEESLGMYKWTKCIHPDDMAETGKRWEHSLQTGEPYMAEYRCLTKEGQWRWMLGRAMPLRSPDTGKIEKWFGTCTDVHASIEAKLAARRTRQQLLSVIAHAHVTIFTVDCNRKITMLEGALIENAEMNQISGNSWYIGGNVDDVFNRLHPELPDGQRPDFLSAIDAIIDRQASDVVVEHSISKLPRPVSDPLANDNSAPRTRLPTGTYTDDRHFRTRFLPMGIRQAKGDPKSDEATLDNSADNEIEGVIGIIMDVTEVKAKEAVLEAQAKEKQQLLANEAAAKEASRLKSQFLANVRIKAYRATEYALLTAYRCLMRFAHRLPES